MPSSYSGNRTAQLNRYAKMNPGLLLVLAVTSSAAGAIGAVPPPRAPSLDGVAARSPPITAITIGSFKVVLEETTLYDVIGAVGFASIGHHGDAGESEYWLCYTTGDSLIWIVSSGEMGGKNHAVTRITALGRTQETSTAGCSPLAAAERGLLVNGKIGLSAPTSNLDAIPGRSIGESGSFGFEYQGKSGASDASRCPPDGFDVENWLIVVSEHGKVNEIYLGQISSC